MRINNFCSILMILCCLGKSLEAKDVPPAKYTKWLEDLKQEMLDRGISNSTVKSAFSKNYYQKKHNVIKQDRNQNEFVLTTTDYLKRVITKDRVKKRQSSL